MAATPSPGPRPPFPHQVDNGFNRRRVTTPMTLGGRDLVSVSDLDDDDVRRILARASRFAGDGPRPESVDLLDGRIVATLFFEPSTRTRLSFEAAAHRLGARTIGFSDASSTSTKKGETLEDTVRMAAGYADCIVMRHPEPGSAARAATAADVPVVNAGDGANEHPTQALLDLFTIQRERGRLDDNRVVLLGDLRHGRTVHSLAVLLARLGNHLTLVSPAELAMPSQVIEACQRAGAGVSTSTDPAEAIADADVVYVTRLQAERFADPEAHARLASSYRVDEALLQHAPSDVTVMHPLPRVDELATEVDARPGAAYFRQAANGVPVRMAVLAEVLGA